MTHDTDGGLIPEPTASDDEIIIQSIAEQLRERHTDVSIDRLREQYGDEIVIAAMRLCGREQRRELAALRRQEKRAHAEWEKRHNHPGVRYAREVCLIHKAKLIKLLIYECPRCVAREGGAE